MLGLKSAGMTSALPQPVPKDLKQQLVGLLDKFEESELVLVHRVFLEMEKQKLWKKIGETAEADRQAGMWDDLDEVIRDVRAKLRQS